MNVIRGFALGLIIAGLLLFLAGCATVEEKQAAANAHYQAQAAHVAAQKPIFELEGYEGETIRLGGVKALRVFASGGQQSQFTPAPVQRSELVEGLQLIKETALGLAPFALGAKVIGGITRISESGHGAVTTTSTVNTSNSSTTTTQTTGSNSVIGSGSASVPNTATTTTSTTTAAPHGTCTTGTC